MSTPGRNIEIKARCGDLDAARAAAQSLGAEPAGTVNQLDTYFRVPNGRLKLREINGERAELIWYVRPDHADARASDYSIVPVTPDAVGSLKRTLATALTVRGEVRKRRELWLWHNVRIHLDTVEHLGTFIEYEAVIGSGEGGDERTAHERLRQLSEVMNVRDEDRLAQSYSDLLGL
jgi:adenylate cyclase class 2